MIDLTVLGIVLKNETVPVLLLHPQHTSLVLQLAIGAAEAYAISTVLYEESSLGEAAGAKGGHFALLRKGAQKASPVALRQEPGARKRWRPQTHDLALELVTQLDGKLLAAEITHAHQGEFFAEMVFKGPQGIGRVACRPADAIALAVRCDATIRCQEGVLGVAEELQPVLENLPDTVRGYALGVLARQLQKQAAVMEQGLSQAEAGQGQPENRKPVVHKGPVITIEVGKPKAQAAQARETVRGILHSLHVDACAVPGFSLPQANEHMAAPAKGTPDDAQWRALLQLLSPETKEPM